MFIDIFYDISYLNVSLIISVGNIIECLRGNISSQSKEISV